MLKQKIVILFCFSPFNQNECEEKHKNLNLLYSDYDFKIMACKDMPSAVEVLNSNIIIFPANSFNMNAIQIKEILKLNPKTWIAVMSYDMEALRKAKNLGVKHRLWGYEKKTPIEEVFSAFNMWYKPNDEITILNGAGFNEKIGLPKDLLILENGELHTTRRDNPKIIVKILCNNKGVFVNKIETRLVWYNECQLKFMFKKPKIIKEYKSQMFPGEYDSIIITKDNDSGTETKETFMRIEPFLIVNRH